MSRKPRLYPPRQVDLVAPEPTPPRFYGYEAKFAEWATANGWDVTKRGWPDFICRRDGAIMAVEVKGGNDQLKPEQIDTLDNLRAAGLPVFVYYDGLGLKEWRGGAPESPARLRLEISKLQELVRKVVQVRDEMIPGVHQPSLPEWDVQRELEVVIEWCAARHSSHGREGTRMTSCSWAYFFREQEGKTFEEIAALLGFGHPPHFADLHRKALREVKSKKLAAAA